MKPKEQYVRMRNFMLERNVGINGIQDLFAWAKQIARENHGKCVLIPNSRPVCPCKESIVEIIDRGLCYGCLFSNKKKIENNEFIFLPYTKLRLELFGKLR